MENTGKNDDKNDDDEDDYDNDIAIKVNSETAWERKKHLQSTK